MIIYVYIHHMFRYFCSDAAPLLKTQAAPQRLEASTVTFFAMAGVTPQGSAGYGNSQG